jgi:hypothetical protein
MSDDAWLRELAQLAQEQEEADRMQLDERWDRLAAGSLSAEESEELRALAETDPEARQAYEAFRPLGPEFKERTLQALREIIARPAPLPFKPKPPAPRPRLLAWSSRRWAGGAAAAAAAAAAAVAVWLGPFGTPSVGVWAPFEVSSGDVLQRSLPSTPSTSLPVYHPGATLHFGLEPRIASKRCEPDLVVECYLAGKEELRPWQGCAKLASFDPCGHGGSVGGPIGDAASDSLPLQPGVSKLWAVIFRKGKPPSADELRKDLLGDPARPCSADDRAGRRNWSAVCVQPLRMEGSP